MSSTTWRVLRPDSVTRRMARPGGTQASVGRPRTAVAVLPAPPLPPPSEQRAAELTAAAALSVTSAPRYTHTGALAAGAALSVQSSPRVPAVAAAAATAVLAVDVSVTGTEVELVGYATAEASLSVQVSAHYPATAELATEAALSVTSAPRYTHTGALAAGAALSVTSAPRYTHTGALAAGAALSVDSAPRYTHTGALATEAALSVDSAHRYVRTGALAAEAALSVVAIPRTDITLDFSYPDGALPSPWATVGLGVDTTVVPEVLSGTARAKQTNTSNSQNQCVGIYTGVSAATDSMAVSVQLVTARNSLYTGPIAFAADDFAYGVFAIITTDSGATGIYTRIGGVITRRTTSSTSAYAAGDYAELRGALVSGVMTYTLVRNPGGSESVISTWADTGGVYVLDPTRRRGGFYHHSSRSISTYSYAPSVDNMRIRDL